MYKRVIQGMVCTFLISLIITAKPVRAEENPDSLTVAASEETTAVPQNGVAQDPVDHQWYYYTNGKVNTSFTGLAKRAQDNCWIFIRNGKWEASYTGMGKRHDTDTWYRVYKGKVDLTFTGVARRPETGVIYYFRKGKLRKDFTGMARSPKTKRWYHVVKGKVRTTYTGGSYYKKNKTWYYFKNGKRKKTFTGFSYEKGKTYYYRNGKRLKGTRTIKGATFKLTGKHGALKGENGLRITWFGDSYTTWSEAKVLSTFPGVDLYAKGGKFFNYSYEYNPSGCSILDDLVARNQVRGIVVFALGTNDTRLSESEVKQVVKRLGKKKKIIFMTPCNRTTYHDYKVTCKSIRKVAKKYKNVYLADWDKEARKKLDKYFAHDPLHPTTGGGFNAWIKVIRNAYRKIVFG